MIEFDQVSLEYRPGEFALRNLSFRTEPGAFLFLTGHSGAGKSSLLRLIARLDRPTSGSIQVGNIHYDRLRPRQEASLRQQMGIVFQDNQLLHDRNVFDNVALPLVIGGYRYRDIVRRVPAALDKVGLLNRQSAMPALLSGGEQQRISIARAVVARPRLLLADEPTGNLDPEISDEIMRLLIRFNDAGVSVIVATHDRTLLDDYALPRMTLKAGELTYH
ncbi:MAG: cell division ATP-binding protein FtsE [Gammaproteobacteria bacterium]|nr:MAG: cell division ATP-binding protein FtsE [Gammaproteobacteria bacterium]